MSVSLRSLDAIRTSADRWLALKHLLRQLEALAQAAALLDADRSGSQKLSEAAAFDDSLIDLQREFTRESTKLTVESLQATIRKRLHAEPEPSPLDVQEIRAHHGINPVRPKNGHTGRTFTREDLDALLARHGGNQTRAAMELRIKPSSLHYLLRRVGIR